MRPTSALLVAFALAGCGRACGRGGAASREDGVVDLGGTDCSDGLVRCSGDRVEASRLAHLPHPCGGSPEGQGSCACPWDVVARCASGCAVPELVAIADPDAGAAQLCRPERPVARPILPGDPAALEARICADRSVVCRDGVVRICDAPGAAERAVAACIAGCATEIAVDHGASAIGDGVAAILCRRDHAERR